MANDRKNTARLMQRGTLTLAAIVVVATIGAWGIGSGFVRAQLAALKLIPVPETYTELYFNNTAQLPTSATAQPVAFSFSIHNVTGQPTNYPYEVILMGPVGAGRIILSGYADTASGQTFDVPVRAQLPKGLVNSQIVVELPNQSQSIDFWIGKTQ